MRNLQYILGAGRDREHELRRLRHDQPATYVVLHLDHRWAPACSQTAQVTIMV